MRLRNEAVTSCKAMAMGMLRGAIGVAVAVAMCFDCLALSYCESVGLLGGVHPSPSARKHMAGRIDELPASSSS